MFEHQSLSDFPLAWRWTSDAYAILPDDVLVRIKPLSESSAQEIFSESIARCASDSGEVFTASDEDLAAARTRLETLPIGDATVILVSWDSATAVETIWKVFREYWNDFCYPSSDDVSVWSPSEDWSLCYRHDEQFTFHGGT